MRGIDYVDGKLMLCWIDAPTDCVHEPPCSPPLAAGETIARDSEGRWKLRTRLLESPFVYMRRLMI